MGMNMEDEELVKMVNPTLKMREAILFFLIVAINGLKCIVSDIRIDTCAKRRWRVEVSKLEMNQPLGKYSIFIMENKEPLTHLMDFPFGPIHSSETPYLTINYVTPAHQINIQQLIL